jgi:hypothetical protein
MPGAHRLGHALDDVAVFKHDLMRGNVGSARAQMSDREVSLCHAGIVQQQHVDAGAALALAEIRRRANLGYEERVGMKFRSEDDHQKPLAHVDVSHMTAGMLRPNIDDYAGSAGKQDHPNTVRIIYDEWHSVAWRTHRADAFTRINGILFALSTGATNTVMLWYQ